MKIVDEQWVDGNTLVVSGFHLDPAKYVIRIHREGKATQTIEFTNPQQMIALVVAAQNLLNDGRTPRQVADDHGVKEGDFTNKRSNHVS